MSSRLLCICEQHRGTEGSLVNFRHRFAVVYLPKSLHSSGHGGDTPRREAKTSSTTSEIQGGCATIYNLASSLLCDSGEERVRAAQ